LIVLSIQLRIMWPKEINEQKTKHKENQPFYRNPKKTKIKAYTIFRVCNGSIKREVRKRQGGR